MAIIDFLKRIIPGNTTTITKPGAVTPAGIGLPSLPTVPSMQNANSTTSMIGAPAQFKAPVVPMVLNKPATPVAPTAAPASSAPRQPVPKTPVSGIQMPQGVDQGMQGAPVVPQPGQPPQPQSPQAPALPTDTEKATSMAQSLYEKSLQITPEELSTQADIDKLVESSRRAYTDIEDKAIPMEFITGQLASVERRAATLAEPLERKLARIQAQRTSSIEASKFALDRADKKATAESTAAKDARTEAESARRFGVEQAGSKETRDLAARKFQQDVKEFGLTYAQNQQKIDQEKAKDAAAAGGGTPQQAAERKTEVLSLARSLRGVDDLGKSTGSVTGKSSAVGASFQKLVPWGMASGLQPGRSTFEAKVNTLKSNLTLDNLKLLKGAMSDKDLAFLNSIASSLETNMREEDFDKELDRIITKLETAGGSPSNPPTLTLNGQTFTLQSDGTYK